MHEPIRGVTVSRNRVIQIDIYFMRRGAFDPGNNWPVCSLVVTV